MYPSPGHIINVMERPKPRQGREAPPPADASYETIAWAAELGDSVPTIDLHGLDAEEAVRQVDQTINHAFMQREDAVKIIHGKGEGTLRAAVRDFLATQTELVAYFRSAQSPGQEQAMTVAVLHHR